MAIQEGDGNLLAEIEKSLSSSKVDPYIAHEFSRHKDDPDFNVSNFFVAILAHVSDPNITVEGVRILTTTANILGMQAPFSSFPDLVAEKKILSLQASRPASLPE